MRANASLNAIWTPEKCEKQLERIEKRREEILTECERVDQEEREQDSWIRLQEELADQKKLRAKVERIRTELEKEGKSSINTTDRECTRIHGRQGSHAGYNGQIVVDSQQGMIVGCDVVNQNNDLGQLGPQIKNACETMGKPRTGKLVVSVDYLDSSRSKLRISVQDDGRGVDPEVIRSVALKRGVLSKQELGSMNPRQLLNLLFMSSFSTKEEVSDFIRFLFEEGRDLVSRVKNDVEDVADKTAHRARQAADHIRHGAN